MSIIRESYNQINTEDLSLSKTRLRGISFAGGERIDENTEAINISALSSGNRVVDIDGATFTSYFGGVSVQSLGPHTYPSCHQRVIVRNINGSGDCSGAGVVRVYGAGYGHNLPSGEYAVIIDNVTFTDLNGYSTFLDINPTSGGSKSVSVACNSHVNTRVPSAKITNIDITYGRAGMFFQNVAELLVEDCTFVNFGMYQDENGDDAPFLQNTYTGTYPEYWKPNSGGQCIKIDNNTQTGLGPYIFRRISTSGTNPHSNATSSSTDGRGQIFSSFVFEDGGYHNCTIEDSSFDSEIRFRGTASGVTFDNCTFNYGCRTDGKHSIYRNCVFASGSQLNVVDHTVFESTNTMNGSVRNVNSKPVVDENDDPVTFE